MKLKEDETPKHQIEGRRSYTRYEKCLPSTSCLKLRMKPAVN